MCAWRSLNNVFSLENVFLIHDKLRLNITGFFKFIFSQSNLIFNDHFIVEQQEGFFKSNFWSSLNPLNFCGFQMIRTIYTNFEIQ